MTNIIFLHHPDIFEDTCRWFKNEYGYPFENSEPDSSFQDYNLDDPKYMLRPVSEMISRLQEPVKSIFTRLRREGYNGFRA